MSSPGADELRHTRVHQLGIRGRVSRGSVGLVIFARPIDDDFRCVYAQIIASGNKP
jgi:hypothetical protein